MGLGWWSQTGKAECVPQAAGYPQGVTIPWAPLEDFCSCGVKKFENPQTEPESELSHALAVQLSASHSKF